MKPETDMRPLSPLAAERQLARPPLAGQARLFGEAMDAAAKPPVPKPSVPKPLPPKAPLQSGEPRPAVQREGHAAKPLPAKPGEASAPQRRAADPTEAESSTVALATAQVEFARPAVLATAATSAPDGEVSAQLERIAAAIAEQSSDGSDPRVHLSLPLGPTHVEGAVLGVDAQGRVAVMLIAAPQLAPGVAAQFTAQLTACLTQRDVRVSRVAFQGRDDDRMRWSRATSAIKSA